MLGIVGVAILITVLLTTWWITHNIYASPFEPTRLSPDEQQVLESKITKLKQSAVTDKESMSPPPTDHNAPLEPEPYTEDEANREIRLSEKEINALVAKNPETARRVAIDLADNLVSVKLLIPMDQELPILGGTTLRVKFGVNVSYENESPVVAMRGVSLGGIPLPKAWWGDIKDKNLIEEFGGEGGFWDQFSKGVDNIKIREGQLWVKLKE